MKIRSLNSRGFAHYLLPALVVVGVGVAGVFAMVSSHANAATPPPTTAAHNPKNDSSNTGTAAKAKVSKKGYLIVYNGQGSFDNAIVTLEGGAAGTSYKCGKQSGLVNTIKLSTKYQDAATRKPTTVKCTPLTTGSYTITYVNGKAGAENQVSKKFTVEAGTCTLVHPDATTLPGKRTLENGHCTGGDQEPDPIVKRTVSMRVLPVVKHGLLKGAVEVSDPSGSLNRAQCSGTASVTISDNTSKTPQLPQTESVKLHFVLASAKTPNVKYSYCAGRLGLADGKKLAAGSYSLKAAIVDHTYLNPVSAETEKGAVVIK